MSSDLIISGGGVVTVATEEMMAAVAGCRSAGLRLQQLASSTRRVVGESTYLPRQPVNGELGAGMEAQAAAAAVSRAADELVWLGHALMAAIDAYARVEWEIAKWVERQVEAAGYLVGRALPVIIVETAPLLLAVGVAAALLARHSPGAAPTAEQTAAQTALRGAILSSPLTAQLVRLLVAGLDDGMRGALQLPPELSAALDEDATDLLGTAAAAALIATVAGGPRLLPDGAVTVRRMRSEPVVAPSSLAEMVNRVPHGQTGRDQIRIERYVDGSGEARSIVYLGGTLEDPDQPWDMASNLSAMGGGDAGSVRAAGDAMRQAGIQPDESVVLVGYSQGGLVASRLTESGDWNVGGVLTVGSPGAGIELPADVPVVSLEHTGDFIPSLSGGSRSPALEPVTVRRELSPAELEASSGSAMPAHQLPLYLETARLADSDTEPRLVAEREAVLAAVAGAGSAAGAGAATAWRADRVSGDAPRGGAAAVR
ncbi:alpha/beta hydrolase [Amnibacterium flavum]|uniref:DUF1023 domain-containing protein n=1 Tax=Amnibacterium flavum TaxID=2173173 RepID=A0A2V1HWB4_9MICO|nr:alpha/beta hydrolase [Amnibacterium flavum]PVZ95459.1 hypothetical protein DDQ50_02830 [Amnibacterium flavum]